MVKHVVRWKELGRCSGVRGSLTSVAATFKCKVCIEGAADEGIVELDLGDV